jgi:uncharacterized glyoxalase superfamily protein PhnB
MSNSFRLYRVIQPVKDIRRAQEFYSTVLGSQGERISPGRHYFDCGGTILACYDPLADGDAPDDTWHHHPKQYLYLSTDDLDGAFEAFNRSGGMLEKPIQTQPWGERSFYGKDPFGNPLCFVEAKSIFTGHSRRV